MLLTLAVGVICGLIFVLLKVPNGLRIGALLGSALLGVFFRAAWMPAQTRFYVQIIAGSFIGCTLDKSHLRDLPRLIKPIAMVLGSFLLLNLTLGALIYFVSPLDWATSFLCVVPGGMTDTPIIAVDMGADPPKVALAMLARWILGVVIFPPMIIAYDNLMEKTKTSRAQMSPSETVGLSPKR